MRRREFMALVGVAAGWPLLAHAQTQRTVGKIGYVHVISLSDPGVSLSLLRPIWQELGYVEGETVLLRSAEGDPGRLPQLVAELIDLGVGVLIVVGPAALRAASQVTKSTPIVAIDLETDPVHAGLAASFSRPGGNVTGLFLHQPSLAGKWLELLKECVPRIERVALVWDPSTSTDQLHAATTAARTIGIETLVLEVRSTERFEEVFRTLGGGRKTGIVQLGSPTLSAFPARLPDTALKYGLPTISFLTPHARAGALLGYGPNLRLYFPRAAILADQILKGAKPGDLPIEQPTKFELAINLKTANALGLTIPPTLLARADEVIE
jgi:putative tryptophan/tyrosine transport system substrate-binding protein